MVRKTQGRSFAHGKLTDHFVCPAVLNLLKFNLINLIFKFNVLYYDHVFLRIHQFEAIRVNCHINKIGYG